MKKTRILIISDIHSNYTALKTVLDTAKPYNQILFAGDIIGFGPHPNKCVDTIMKLRVKAVTGNHDQVIITNDYSRLSEDVGKADSLNRTIIKKENLTSILFFTSLPSCSSLLTNSQSSMFISRKVSAS